jgi:hypothetical protein
MNVNYGLFPPIEAAGGVGPDGRKKRRLPKREKNRLLAERALEAIETYRLAVGGLASGGLAIGGEAVGGDAVAGEDVGAPAPANAPGADA